MSLRVPDLFSVDGKVALVTGGATGIGRMIAEGLVVNGARVFIASRNATSVNKPHRSSAVSVPAPRFRSTSPTSTAFVSSSLR